jgi:hypothetical protein
MGRDGRFPREQDRFDFVQRLLRSAVGELGKVAFSTGEQSITLVFKLAMGGRFKTGEACALSRAGDRTHF